MSDVTSDTENTVTEIQAATTDALEQTTAVTTESFDQTVAAVNDGLTEATSTVEASQLQFKQGITKTMKTAEEVVAFSQGNVEALIKSGQIWSTGLQDISKQVASSMQASYEETMAAFKALTTVKSLKEAVDLQVGLARSVMEKGVTEFEQIHRRVLQARRAGDCAAVQPRDPGRREVRQDCLTRWLLPLN